MVDKDMNFLEMLHEILISLCIAILFPITLYWGISTIYVNPEYPKTSNYQYALDDNNTTSVDKAAKKAQENFEIENWKKAKEPFDKAIFFSSLLFGFLLIIFSSFIAIKTLSIGLLMGGIIDIMVGLCFNPGIAILNFCIFLIILVAIIYIVIIKSKK